MTGEADQGASEPTESTSTATPAADQGTDHFDDDQSGSQQQPAGGEGGDTLATGGKPEAKADGGDSKPGEGKDGEGKGGGESSYESFQMPEMEEGQQVDQGLIDAVSPIMQKYDLDQAAAQELVSAGAEYLISQQKAAREAHAKQVDQWGDDSFKDPDFGNGDEETFKRESDLAAKALAHYGSPELTTLLSKAEGYGLGNHPAVVKALAKIGKDIGEDGTLSGAGGNKQVDDADLLYGEK